MLTADVDLLQLRDIELMIQDRIALIENPMEGEEKIPEGGPEEVLLKQIQAVLYSTEDGFEVPEGQEVSEIERMTRLWEMTCIGKLIC
jgi:RP/EB family microtubule-associated protein